MDLDRPPHHRTPSASTTTTTPTGELFVCFTSRLSSSSSMKLSKSILSPGRARDPSVSLSTSLSRRLRSNGSIKAGQASPMFPSSAKKRGSAFENPEPSSPKVTCIGQVRVKTKKKVKHSRSLSTRRSGDLSFRKVEQAQDGMNLSEERDRLCLQNQRSSSVHYQQQECAPHRNQRWVHLPLTICEALRAEFSCLFPCRSSCFSTNEREKEEKGNGSKDNSHRNGQQQQEQRSCGAVFARWLVAVQDGEGGKGREIELVVAGGDDEERITAGRPSTTMRSSRSRRHVFEDIDFKDESFVAQKGDGEEAKEEEEKARVSICIPPKNALLLMRCRSDPMKMAALTNRFWETPAATKNEDSDGHGGEAVEKQEVEIQKGESKCQVAMEKECEEVAEQNVVSSVNLEEKEEDSEEETTMEMEVVSIEEEEAELKPEEEEAKELEVENQQEDSDLVSADSQIDQQNTENVEPDNPIPEQDSGEEEGSITPLSISSPINSPEQASCETEENIAPLPLEASVQEEYAEIGDDEDTEEITGHESEEEEEEEDELEEEGEEEEEESDTEIEYTTLKEELEKEEASEDDESVKKVSKKDILPECLLLMMCEPKLSMEVSKETWVCSTDFIRWLPERQQVKVSKTDASDDSNKKLSMDTKKSSGTNPTRPAPPPDNKNHHLLQPPRSSFSLPPRSSCSLPAAAVSGVSMASMIEQKLVNAVGYEPFVLTRCKSEPMRTAAKLAAAEPCFWKNRKLEPHRRATFGFGAAGVGF